MHELLNEMGKVCNNRKIAEYFKNFYRKRFNDLYKCNMEQAQAHQQQFLFWSKKIQDMNEHIKQIHVKIQKKDLKHRRKSL